MYSDLGPRTWRSSLSIEMVSIWSGSFLRKRLQVQSLERYPCQLLLPKDCLQIQKSDFLRQLRKLVGVGPTFLVHIMLLCDFFSSSFNQIAGVCVIQVIIDVDNGSFFHGNSPIAPYGGISATNHPYFNQLGHF